MNIQDQAFWKNRVVWLTLTLLGLSLAFLITGYTALYWGWLRGDTAAALPYLPWARNSGALAIFGAFAAFAILFSAKTFRISHNYRLALSILASVAIAFFAEFRNEGKFYFKARLHFFGPGTWIHDSLNNAASTLGDFFYRVEYSHWNDFLMGPAIVSVLYCVVFLKIYAAYRNQGPIDFQIAGDPSDLEHALRFARILLNVGLFWFFIQAWAEKAGYVRNPHSNDEIDFPFEFAGTMLGFWMTRILTKPFSARAEKFRSTVLVDFVASGLIGLLYTLLVGPFTEGVANIVADALYPEVPNSLAAHEYTPLQRHLRPFELLLLAATMWWSFNRFQKQNSVAPLSILHEPQEGELSDQDFDLVDSLEKSTKS